MCVLAKTGPAETRLVNTAPAKYTATIISALFIENLLQSMGYSRIHSIAGEMLCLTVQ